MQYIFLVIFSFFYTFSPFIAQAEEIKIGMSTALTGPTKNLGIEISQGANLYFSQYNKTREKKLPAIKLITYDDGYEPHQTVLNTRKLIEKDKVFALFSYVGTPTSRVVMPILENKNILYFSPFTGADFLRTPVKENIFNIRANYFNEAQTQVNYFIPQQSNTKVALFIQADEFGLSAIKGYKKALKNVGITQYQQVRYKRNTSEISIAVTSLLKSNPDIIFCVGTYEPIAKLINELRAANNTSKIVMLSFAGGKYLQQRLTAFNDIYITSVFPSPEHSSVNIIKQYRKAMGDMALSAESLEGYINAATFTEIIKQMQNKKQVFSQENFINTAENINFQSFGLPLNFSQTNHQALNNTYLYQFTKVGLKQIALKK